MVKFDVKPPLLWLVKRSWQYVLYRSWFHTRASVRIYRALAERERDESRSSMLLRLAAHAERRGNLKEEHLRKLKDHSLTDHDYLDARVWRWLLVRCGIKWSLTWIHRIENRNLLLSKLLVRLTARILSKASSWRGDGAIRY
jgi:hypothetical protein